MQIHTSSNLLVHTNMFLKIQNAHQHPLDVNVERHDSLTVRCLSVVLYSFSLRSAFCQWFCSLLLLQGIIFFGWSGGWDVCDRVWCFACRASRSSHLSHAERRRPVPASTKTGMERSARQWSIWALHTHTHTHTHTHINTHDGHRRQAQLPSLLLESRTPIIKCPPSPIKTNSLDCMFLLSIGLTDTNDCVIHPPLPHPLVTAPVSHRALAQSRGIVSCLFLNTHLYLTAYWVSVSPDVHYVWMCSWACVCECVCQLLQWVYVASAICLSCSPLFPILKVCLSIKQHGRREGGGRLAEGGPWWGVLRRARTPIPSTGGRYQEWDECGGGGGSGSGEQGRESDGGGREWWWWGGGGLLEWKNTISPALLQCLSSQLVTLKDQSWVIISNCWRNRTQRFGPVSRFSSALMGERELNGKNKSCWGERARRREGKRGRDGETGRERDGQQKWLGSLKRLMWLWLNLRETPEPVQSVLGKSTSRTMCALYGPGSNTPSFLSSLSNSISESIESF